MIDQPLFVVFRFYAYDHVRNHPNWDPDMELEQLSEGPIGVGTVVRECSSLGGPPIRGTMEVVQFARNQSLGMAINDGLVEIRGPATFEAADHNRTTLTWNIEFPGMDESMDTTLLANQMERSVQYIKHLIESEF
ncbi:MAG: hypothetical protein BMS9Abin02_1779 [Anaerolineae bacterium]|nr:MAG: hypothetical protein BMS9Abin02_1779 [Anaerolineae bacterium]